MKKELEFSEDNFEKLKTALRRISNPADKCNQKVQGLWIDIAFEALYNRKMTEEDLYDV